MQKFSAVPTKAIWSQIFALIPVYMNVFMLGCANGWLPNAIYFLMIGDEVYATSSQCALVASISELGRIIFAVPAGFLTDKYGRKKITIIVALLHFFIWLGISLDTSLITICVGRFITGVATALVNATALISIGEIASPEIRGQLIGTYQIFMMIGGILPSLISVIFVSYKSLAWGITCFSIISLLSMICVTEPPSFLVSVSKLKEAKHNLGVIRKGYEENSIYIEFERLKKYIEDEKARKSQLSWLKFFKSKEIRKPLITEILLNFFSVLTGGLVISAYVTALYPSNDYVSKKYYPLITQVMYLFIAISTTFYIDKFPRRTIFMIGAAGMIVINALCALTSYFDMDYENIFKRTFTLGNIILIVCYAASVQPMNSAIKSELFPQAVKGFCGSIAVISQASSTIVSYQLYYLMKNCLHVYLMYVVFSICSFILYLCVYFLLPEARGEFLTDFQMKFKKNPTSCGNGTNVENGDRNLK